MARVAGMPNAVTRALRLSGWALLWGAAAVAVALSAAALLAALPATRPLAAAALVRWADDAVAGSLTLEGIAVLPSGGVELRGLRAFDPEGAPVLRVDRARLFLESFDVAYRELGLSAALTGLEIDAARRGADGELALARALAPVPGPARTPAPGKGGAREAARPARRGWTLDVTRLAISDARVLAELPGAGPVDAAALALGARGRWAPTDAWLELSAEGRLAAPVEAPLSLQLRAVRDGARVALERLVAGLGGDRLEAVGEGDLERRTGRIAVTRLDVSKGEAGALAPAARIGGELAGTIYAESDGAFATAALEVAPATTGGGRARVAGAARLPPGAQAWGLHADLERFDPSRVSLLAPPGSITLRGRGAAKGTRLADLSGRLQARLEPSRLRGGTLGPVEVQATAGGGSVEVARLEAVAPGGAIDGKLRWGEGGEVGGTLTVLGRDLEALERNLAAVLGRSVPDLEGSGRAEVSLSGTSAAPRLDAEVDAPRLGIGRVRADGARLHVELQGPAATPSGRVRGRLDGARVGGLELRAVELDAGLGEDVAAVAFTASAPKLGTDPLRAVARGRWGSGRSHFLLEEGLLAWPGTRFALAEPARIDTRAPAVDRLVLEADAQRIELSGGVARDGALDARLRVANLDLARLPRGLAPPEADLAGLLAVDARASGTRDAPRVDATVGLTGASAWQVGGLQLLGEVAWDGEAERIEADLGLVRARGGALDLSFDLPIALAKARGWQEVRVEVRGRELPVDELVWLAGSYELVAGDLDVEASLTGSVAAPRLQASLSARNGSWDDLEGLGLDATIEAPGDRLRVRASGTVGGAGGGSAEGEGTLDLGRLLSVPREEVAAARRAPATLTLRVPRLDLGGLAGRMKLPGDLRGIVEAEASLAGSPAAPRGTLRAAVREGAGWGARAVGGRLDVALAPERSGVALALELGGEPAARLDGTIDLPAERLSDATALAAAPFRADVTVARSDLAAWGGALLALRGSVEGRGSLQGTPGAPQGEIRLAAEGAVVEGRPLGAVSVAGRYAARRTTVAVELAPPAGGALHADGSLDHPLGLGSGAGPLREAPAELRVVAERLDLGFLPALAPGVVRAAAGAATLDLSAAGALGELRPRGGFRVSKGRLALAELGEWTDAAIEAKLGEDAVELTRFDVRKGKGTLSLRGALRGLSRPGVPAELEATLRTDDFGVERAGMELARFDLSGEARGQLTREGLTLGLVLPQAEVRLPKRIPRSLQETGGRKDITVGRPAPKRARRTPPAGPAAPGAAPAPAEAPFKIVVHVAAPRRLRVRADSPRIDVELKADALLAFAGGRDEATGAVEVVRGQVEPIGGRVFEVRRGKLTFTGDRIATGVLDVVAEYENPAAKVTAVVGGTLSKPQLSLTSEPPMEEAQIALLVATGRTEVKAGTGGVNTLAAGDAGLAAAGAFMTGVFKDLLADKLPVDSVSLDSTAASVGKYLTDRIYVGYVRRFDAKPEKGENPDEVRFEYQLAPGWQVETRYGSAQSGSASIVWTRTY